MDGDDHERAGVAIRAAIAELKQGRERKSRALAAEQLGRPPPVFVNTVVRKVAFDAVIYDPSKEGDAA